MNITGGAKSLSMVAVVTTLLHYAVLTLFGHANDFFSKLIGSRRRVTPPGFAPLLKDFDDFFTRHFYRRIHDCWNRPISTMAGAYVDVLERTTNDHYRTLQLSGSQLTHTLNLASYNYLGFAERDGPCADAVDAVLDKFSVAIASTPAELGTTRHQQELENLVAEFVGKEDAMVFGMGFATNSTAIPALVGPGDLVISDSRNHASIVVGVRGSGARVRVFQHNDFDELEQMVREAIAHGQPHIRRQWRRIMIFVEGVYSMEGEILQLARIIDIKRRYRCYVYLDEAHSIGAIGPTGRGCTEQNGLDSRDVDVMMGTFTKSFGSSGGYIAGPKALIAHLRTRCWGHTNAIACAPACVEQTMVALKILMGRVQHPSHSGIDRINQLRTNSNYFRRRLVEMGFEVYGSDDSPVIPAMVYSPAKVTGFSRECLRRGVAVVVVGYPATPLVEARVRFCLSASHTREDLDFALEVIDEVGDLCLIKYNRKSADKARAAAAFVASAEERAKID